jgi:ribonuclease HI
LNEQLPKEVQVFTDGACLGNPGPGGYGIILAYRDQRKEMSGGARLTTNNRMELIAVVKALETLKERCVVRVYSDSEYVVKGIRLGWAAGWKANGWKKRDRKPAINSDLWKRLLELCEGHQVEMNWVRGHAGHVENERCDALAVAAAHSPDLPADEEYEQSLAASR